MATPYHQVIDDTIHTRTHPTAKPGHILARPGHGLVTTDTPVTSYHHVSNLSDVSH